MKPLTVLQIIPSLDMGGTERNVLRIAATLAAAGHRALVISSGGRLVAALEQAGGHHVAWPVSSKNPLTILNNKRRLIDFAQQENVDILHAHSRAPAWSAYLAAQALRLPFVTTYHSAHKGKSALKRHYNSVMARGDRIIVASRFIAEHIRAQHGTAPERIVLIPHGIDLDTFNPQFITEPQRNAFRTAHALPPQTPLIVMPARLSPIKGHELAIRALHDVDRPFLCLMIGSDQGRTEYSMHLNRLVDELNLRTKVKFLESADLPTAYAAADLVLSPSQVPEGFGLVPVEAQAMGVPVIASAAGATLETIKDGETGWLVPVGEAKALTSAIRHALSLSRGQREAMSRLAVAHARANFDVRQMGAATLAVYDDLARQRQNNALGQTD